MQDVSYWSLSENTCYPLWIISSNCLRQPRVQTGNTPLHSAMSVYIRSYFILSQQLQDKRQVDYVKFINSADPQILKNFVKNVTTNFCIKNGQVASILFKNGIELQFFYKPSEDGKSPETL